jgi:4-hydroxy-tetrahydrodipicolinate synthase
MTPFRFHNTQKTPDQIAALNQFPLWTALVTPFKAPKNPEDSLEVDYASLRSLILEQEQAGNGLLILGSTAEALNLSLEMKKEIVTTVLTWGPKVPVMIGVGGHDLPACVDWLKWLNQLDDNHQFHSLLMVTPHYAKPGAEGQYHWFKTLMDLSSKPVMLYNVPGRSGIALNLKAVERLYSHPQLWAIKEASGSVERMKEYKTAMKEKAVFCGDDGLTPEFTAQGAQGLVSVASNVWPEATHLYVKQNLSKTFDASELWKKASDSLFLASNPVPAKAILAEQKRISSNVMMPPLSHLDLNATQLAEIKNYHQQVIKWFEEQK